MLLIVKALRRRLRKLFLAISGKCLNIDVASSCHSSGFCFSRSPFYSLRITGARKFRRCLQNYRDLESITDEEPRKSCEFSLANPPGCDRKCIDNPLGEFQTQARRGQVVNVAGKGFFAEFEDGHVKHFVVPDDFKFDVQGKQLTVRDLKRGVNLTRMVMSLTHLRSARVSRNDDLTSHLTVRISTCT